MKSLEAVQIELETFTNKKCELCGKTLKHDGKVTQVVYCHRCNGIFCIKCWLIQRAEEDRKL